MLRKALAIDPELPEALTSLAAVRKMGPADVPWRDAAERVLARGLPVAHAINLHHALGKYYDDVDDRDAAFQHHLRGNELARASRPGYDRVEMTQRVTRTLAAFDRNVLAALRSGGLGSERPVFVVGMPRSGTSLTEQILASHPEVHGAGELLYWIFAADAERAAPAETRAATIAELGRAYLEGLAAQAPAASRVVDKLPVNFRNIGLIHAALPGTRFIHLNEMRSIPVCRSTSRGSPPRTPTQPTSATSRTTTTSTGAWWPTGAPCCRRRRCSTCGMRILSTILKAGAAACSRISGCRGIRAASSSIAPIGRF